MTLESNDPRLTAYALGELEPREAALVEAELNASPEGQRALAEIRATADRLRQAFVAELALSAAEAAPILSAEARALIIAAGSGGEVANGEAATIGAAAGAIDTAHAPAPLRPVSPAARRSMWVRTAQWSRRHAAAIGVCSVVCAILAALLLPIEQAREAARRTVAMNDFDQSGQAVTIGRQQIDTFNSSGEYVVPQGEAGVALNPQPAPGGAPEAARASSQSKNHLYTIAKPAYEVPGRGNYAPASPVPANGESGDVQAGGGQANSSTAGKHWHYSAEAERSLRRGTQWDLDEASSPQFDDPPASGKQSGGNAGAATTAASPATTAPAPNSTVNWNSKAVQLNGRGHGTQPRSKGLSRAAGAADKARTDRIAGPMADDLNIPALQDSFTSSPSPLAPAAAEKSPASNDGRGTNGENSVYPTADLVIPVQTQPVISAGSATSSISAPAGGARVNINEYDSLGLQNQPLYFDSAEDWDKAAAAAAGTEKDADGRERKLGEKLNEVSKLPGKNSFGFDTDVGFDVDTRDRGAVVQELRKKLKTLEELQAAAPAGDAKQGGGRDGGEAVELMARRVVGPPADERSNLQLKLSMRAEAIKQKIAELEQIEDSNTESYAALVENPFQSVAQQPLSTFSIDVDTASYANVRRFLNQNTLPPPGAVRIEEMINYFHYGYDPPKDDAPFAANAAVAVCPWAPAHRLVRIGLKGREIAVEDRPASNLVFLIDVSGSMQDANKLPLVKEGLRLLVEKLGENDRVAMVVYAGASGLVLPSTLGSEREKIMHAIEQLDAGGSTNGGAGIELAYQTAVAHFIKGGANRVILATDGDFNVGVTDESQLVPLIERKAASGVFLSVLGFGMGNFKDSNLEKLADKGNGNYAYIDSLAEARKVLVEELSGTLVTIAKDVKIQIEFNPAKVQAYRLIGYENRMLAKEDFNDDKKDAGEIGAGHTVTALYEVVPGGAVVPAGVAGVDKLEYQNEAAPNDAAAKSNDLLTLKLRYKEPDGDTSKLLKFPVADGDQQIGAAGNDFEFAASVAAFGMLLRGSAHKGAANFAMVLELARHGKGADREGYRHEFVNLVEQAKRLAPQ